MSKPVVSVCLITYNHAAFIEQAIEGVLMQQINFPIELIIADDCSTDGTRDIVKSYQQKYPDLIHLILQEKNVGPAQNWLDLLSAPTGKYMAYFEGDDYWTGNTKLQSQVDWMELHQEYAACFHDALELNELTNECKPFRPVTGTNFSTAELLENEWFIATHSVLYRRDALQFPAWISRVRNGDYALLLLASLRGNIYRFASEWGVYRVHAKGLSMQFLQLRHLISHRIQLLSYFNLESDFRFSTIIEAKNLEWLDKLGPHQVFHTYTEDRPFFVKVLSLDFWLRKGKQYFSHAD